MMGYPVAAILGLALLAQAPKPVDPLPGPIDAHSAADWDAKFRATDGWIGGDAAYSVPISPDRTVWLFDDSFVGKVRDGKRIDAVMVNSAVAIQDGHGEAAKVRFVVRRGADGKPRSLLTPDDGKGWYWPQAATFARGKLHLLLAQIEGAGDGAFGFRQVGTWLATVPNPADDPLEWRFEQKKLPFFEASEKKIVCFGAATLLEGEDLYIYGIDEERGVERLPNKRMIVAKVKADAVADFPSWRFFREGSWVEDFHRAGPLADRMANESSVSRLPGRDQFVTVYTKFGLSDEIVARVAPSPVGPWSEPTTLYRCPEAKTDRKAFCYAAKAHPEESSGDELLITYATNSFDFAHVLNDARLYWPRFVKVTWKGR